jgi:hypothetical protein
MQSSNLNPPFDPAVKDTTVSSATDPLPQSASVLYDSGSSDSLIGNLSDNSFPQSRAASIGSDSTVPDSGQTNNTTLENSIIFQTAS